MNKVIGEKITAGARQTMPVRMTHGFLKNIQSNLGFTKKTNNKQPNFLSGQNN